MQTNVIEVGNPLGEERVDLLAEADVEAAFRDIVDELEALPAATVQALDEEHRGKIWGGNDPDFLSHRR